MIGLIWNIRDFSRPGRSLALSSYFQKHRVDFVGLQETKKESFSHNSLKNLTNNVHFNWHFLPAVGTAGGMLVGANADLFNNSVKLPCKRTGFSWKLIVVYGSPYEEGKQEFIDELNEIMNWQGPTMISRDFNLSRLCTDKSNNRINNCWADAFIAWISRFLW